MLGVFLFISVSSRYVARMYEVSGTYYSSSSLVPVTRQYPPTIADLTMLVEQGSVSD